MITIRQAENGYVVQFRNGNERIFFSTETLFAFLLLHFEGLADTFQGDLFGCVSIERHHRVTLVKNEE